MRTRTEPGDSGRCSGRISLAGAGRTEALLDGCERYEGAVCAQFFRGGTGRGGHGGQPFGQGRQSVAVAFQSLTFVLGEVELFEHLVDAFLDGQELAAGGGT